MTQNDPHSSDDFDTDGFPKKSPFRHNEVVEIHPGASLSEPEAITLDGKRGVVCGWACDDAVWYYGIVVQSGIVWYFNSAEIERVGVILTNAELHGPPAQQEWARINSDGERVAGDASFLKRGPTPLAVDLEQIVRSIRN